MPQVECTYISAGDYSTCETITIASDVTSIPSQSFRENTNLKALIFNQDSALHTIGAGAFRECVSLSGDIILPSNLLYIRNTVFDGCSQIQSIDFSQATKLLIIEYSAFQGCTNIDGIDLSRLTLLKSFGSSAFRECTNLKGTITIPNCIESIGAYAFYSCSGLAHVLIDPNETLLKIGQSVFAECSSLLSFKLLRNVGKMAFDANSFQACNSLEWFECTLRSTFNKDALPQHTKLATVRFYGNHDDTSPGVTLFSNRVNFPAMSLFIVPCKFSLDTNGIETRYVTDDGDSCPVPSLSVYRRSIIIFLIQLLKITLLVDV